MLNVTGYTDSKDLCEGMFMILGLLELQHHQYIETDAFYTNSN